MTRRNGPGLAALSTAVVLLCASAWIMPAALVSAAPPRGKGVKPGVMPPVLPGAPAAPSGDAGGARTHAPGFAATVEFIGSHATVFVLKPLDGGARVAVSPDMAGRVMVSTYAGDAGPALGWINRPVVAGKRDEQFVNYGGAERLWLSPEGGKFSPFFAPGTKFTFENWRVPGAFNNEPLKVRAQSTTRIEMEGDLELVNHAGTALSLKLERTVSLLEPAEAAILLDCGFPEGVDLVAYRTDNAVTNRGTAAMTKKTGLVSLWILAMFTPSKDTLVLAPVLKGAEGPVVIDDYFGKVPPDRLVYDRRQACVVFRADGRERGKIGIPPARARDVIASIDYENELLTIMKFSRSGEGSYLANAWKDSPDPFGGDAVNSYNDGPPAPGMPALGGFYELENLSPAKELKPGGKLSHWSAVVHLHGPLAKLAMIGRRVLGVDILKLERPGRQKGR